MTRNTLILLQQILNNQSILVGAPDSEIKAVLQAKKEVAQAVLAATKQEKSV